MYKWCPTVSVNSPPNFDIWNSASLRDLLMPPIPTEIQRHVFHPSEALRLPGFETHNGSTPTRGVNYNETLSSVGQRRKTGFLCHQHLEL